LSEYELVSGKSTLFVVGSASRTANQRALCIRGPMFAGKLADTGLLQSIKEVLLRSGGFNAGLQLSAARPAAANQTIRAGTFFRRGEVAGCDQPFRNHGPDSGLQRPKCQI
jgi:hypothetical protein